MNDYWNFLESKYPSPKAVGTIKKIKFEKLKKAIDSKNEKFLKKLIRGMYIKKEAKIFMKSQSIESTKTNWLDLHRVMKDS